MDIKSYLSDLLQEYRENLPEREHLFFTSRNETPSLNELRRLEVFPPVYVLIMEKIESHKEVIFRCAVLTEEIELGYLGETPLIALDELRTIIVTLPLSICFTETFLTKYSTKICYVSEEKIRRIQEYISERKIPHGTVKGEYIELVADRLKKLQKVQVGRKTK